MDLLARDVSTGGLMILLNPEVAFLERSKKAAGFPVDVTGNPKTPKIIEKLGKAKAGSGHDNFLKGIQLFVDIRATQNEWLQLLRYTHLVPVSSQSKMYTITKVDLDEFLDEDVNLMAKQGLMMELDAFEKHQDYQRLMSNVPSGLMLTCAMATNYMCLKNMFNQRKHHKLKGWKGFHNVCAELPDFLELTGCKMPK